ncbi:MAG: ribonuclease III domain-containing protein [Cyanobacteria bacterium J06621_11]
MTDLPDQSSPDQSSVEPTAFAAKPLNSEPCATEIEASLQPTSAQTASNHDTTAAHTKEVIAQAQLPLHPLKKMLPKAMSATELKLIKPIALAYLGDAVFELYVRSRLLHPPKRIRNYHQQVVSRVNAESQSHYVDILSPYLTDSEKDLLRRGRNATTGKNRRAKGQDYQKATGLEALVGFLYLSDLPRLLELLSHLEISDQALDKQPTKTET